MSSSYWYRIDALPISFSRLKVIGVVIVVLIAQLEAVTSLYLAVSTLTRKAGLGGVVNEQQCIIIMLLRLETRLAVGCHVCFGFLSSYRSWLIPMDTVVRFPIVACRNGWE